MSNLKTGAWSEFRDGGIVPYDCAECHATGYQPGGNPTGFPGIQRTFALAGVACATFDNDIVGKGGPDEKTPPNRAAFFCKTRVRVRDLP